MGRIGVVDLYNRDLFYGPIDYVPHLDKVHFVLDVPFGNGKKWLNQKGIVNQVLGGGTLSGFAILRQRGSLLTRRLKPSRPFWRLGLPSYRIRRVFTLDWGGVACRRWP